MQENPPKTIHSDRSRSRRTNQLHVRTEAPHFAGTEAVGSEQTTKTQISTPSLQHHQQHTLTTVCSRAANGPRHLRRLQRPPRAEQVRGLPRLGLHRPAGPRQSVELAAEVVIVGVAPVVQVKIVYIIIGGGGGVIVVVVKVAEAEVARPLVQAPEPGETGGSAVSVVEGAADAPAATAPAAAAAAAAAFGDALRGERVLDFFGPQKVLVFVCVGGGQGEGGVVGRYGDGRQRRGLAPRGCCGRLRMWTLLPRTGE